MLSDGFKFPLLDVKHHVNKYVFYFPQSFSFVVLNARQDKPFNSTIPNWVWEQTHILS